MASSFVKYPRDCVVTIAKALADLPFLPADLKVFKPFAKAVLEVDGVAGPHLDKFQSLIVDVPTNLIAKAAAGSTKALENVYHEVEKHIIGKGVGKAVNEVKNQVKLAAKVIEHGVKDAAEDIEKTANIAVKETMKVAVPIDEKVEKFFGSIFG
jgi:hypothetical protein